MPEVVECEADRLFFNGWRGVEYAAERRLSTESVARLPRLVVDKDIIFSFIKVVMSRFV